MLLVQYILAEFLLEHIMLFFIMFWLLTDNRYWYLRVGRKCQSAPNWTGNDLITPTVSCWNRNCAVARTLCKTLSRLCWPELVFFGPWMSLRLRRKVFKLTNSRFESGGDHPQNIVQRCEKRRLTITSFVFVPLGQRCVQHITARLSQDASSAF